MPPKRAAAAAAAKAKSKKSDDAPTENEPTKAGKGRSSRRPGPAATEETGQEQNQASDEATINAENKDGMDVVTTEREIEHNELKQNEAAKQEVDECDGGVERLEKKRRIDIEHQSRQDSPLSPAVTNSVEKTGSTSIQSSRRLHSGPVTIQDIVQDKITQIASERWAPGAEGAKVGVFDEDLIKELYLQEILPGDYTRLQLLEFSGYLDHFLWPHYNPTKCCEEHTLSIIFLLNQKFREGIMVFTNLTATPQDAEKFEGFFNNIIQLSSSSQFFSNSHSLRLHYISLFINIFRSLENPVVKKCALKFVSLAIWESLSPKRLDRALDEYPQLRRHWEQHVMKTSGDGGKKKPAKNTNGLESLWLPNLIENFMETMESLPLISSPNKSSSLQYLIRFLDFLIDLLSQLPTRRFLATLLDDMHLVVRCRRVLNPRVMKEAKGNNSPLHLLHRLVENLDSYIHFEVNDQTGKALSIKDSLSLQGEKINRLQQVAFSDYKDSLQDLIFASVGELSKRENLIRYFKSMSDADLQDLSMKLGIISEKDVSRFSSRMEHDGNTDDENHNTSLIDFIIDVLVDALAARASQLDHLNRLSLYPTEELLWDPTQVPSGNAFRGEQVLALPKLNLQFLTIHDYLMRNFFLFRIESAYEIRSDLVDAIKRMGPKEGHKGVTLFSGWARMAIPAISLSIDEVSDCWKF